MRASRFLHTGLRSVIALFLAFSVLSAPNISPAHALTLEKIAAPWENLYRSSAPITYPKFKTKKDATSSKSLGIPSVFKINYVNVPAEEQPAVQAAINVWANNWSSSVDVNVIVNYVPEGTAGILASASPVNFLHNFVGAPDPNLWYPSAMANALAGKDLDGTNPEINININSTLSNIFYLGTDGNCPSNLYDLESILLHEIAHGLGFLSNDSLDRFSGLGSIDQPTPFDAYSQTPDGGRLMDLASPSLALGAALQSPLVWSGKNGVAANNGIKPLLYTPNPYEPGSSVSHLDEQTFQNAGSNALMTPSWPAGAVFHYPGTLVLAMFADMRIKPPPGIPGGIPNSPRNVFAIIGDKSAIVNFDPPDNARSAEVSSYTVTVNETNRVIQATTSPVEVTGLHNGSHYSFSVTASNLLGTSPPQSSNAIYPQAPWKPSVIDPVANAKFLRATTFQGQPVVVYTNGKNGELDLALWNGKVWKKSVIDGNSLSNGRTRDNLVGGLSVCTSVAGKNQRLDVIYSDMTRKTLRYAGYNGKKWQYNVIDGNGTKVIKYSDPLRYRTASDVTGANSCVDTPDGLQIFYRDQSQGILLAAVQLGSPIGRWGYQVVDGDAPRNGRTTGDVAFHLKALNIGRSVYVLYDSVLQVNQQRQILQGEVRLATRSSAYPEDWKYLVLDTNGPDTAVAGFDVSLTTIGRDITGVWMAASGTSIPNPDQLRWVDISNNGPVISTSTDYYGTPNAPLVTDGQRTLFNCQNRLCSMNNVDQSVSLVSSSNLANSMDCAWITLNKVRYAVVGVDGKLELFKAI